MASVKIKQPDGSYKKIQLNGDIIQNVTAGEGIHIDDDGVISSTIKQTSAKADDIPRLFIDGSEVNSITSKADTANVKYTYVEPDGKTTVWYGTLKWQGTSSLSYPKKNFTIKLFSNEERTVKAKVEMKEGWGAQNKYCLKANYIDPTHARNIICARLWGRAVASRENILDNLKNAPNYGAIDGFHIKLYLNGIYQGMYTWNIPKDGWMFNMSKTDNTEAVLCCEVQTEKGQFRQAITGDGSDWSLEYPEEYTSDSQLVSSFNNFINFIKTSTDDNFKTQINNYSDIEALLDYYLFCYYFAGIDQLGKNMLMITYDSGAHWIPSAYDMDTTWGAYWDGTAMISTSYKCPGQYECSNSLLWSRIEHLFATELYQRYLELTDAENGPWSLGAIFREFEDFYNTPRQEYYSRDRQIYTAIPTATDFLPMENYMGARKIYVDECIKEIGMYVEPTGITFEANPMSIQQYGIYKIVLKGNSDEESINKLESITFSINNAYASIVEYNRAFYVLGRTVGSSTLTATGQTKEGNSISGTLNLTISSRSTPQPKYQWLGTNLNGTATTWASQGGSSSGNITFSASATNDNVSSTTNSTVRAAKFTVDSNGVGRGFYAPVSLGTGAFACEFIGTVPSGTNATFNSGGTNSLIQFGPDQTAQWGNCLGFWKFSNTGQFYMEQGSVASREIISSFDTAEVDLQHFIIQRDSTGYVHFYSKNADGSLFSWQSTYGSTQNVAYVGNNEGSRQFEGSILGLKMYSTALTEAQIKTLLDIKE